MHDLVMAGSIQTTPHPPTTADALAQSIDLSFRATYDAALSASLPISGTFTVPIGAMSAVRAFALRSVDGASFVATISTAAGANQVVPVSDLFVFRASATGSPITAISISGGGRIEYMVGGNR